MAYSTKATALQLFLFLFFCALFFRILYHLISKVNEKENTNSRSIGDISQIGLYHWEIRDLGSNFSNEIRFAKLLASIATAIFSYFLFFRINQQTSKPLTYQPFSAYGLLIFLALLKSKR